MTSEQRPIQKRNRYKILVSFPVDWPDEPALAGQTIELFFPTLDAASLAASGFRLRGASA